jgi:TM2 domain-containing membrane protein YozV
VSDKKPLISAFLSALFPGAGQCYNEEVIKGRVLFICFVSLSIICYITSGITRLTFALAVFIVWISIVVDAYKTAQQSGKPLEWYYNTAYVVSMLLLVGPIALPLLWRSYRFSKIAKIVWTSVVIAAFLFVFIIPQILSWLIRQSPELEEILKQSGIQI